MAELGRVYIFYERFDVARLYEGIRIRGWGNCQKTLVSFKKFFNFKMFWAMLVDFALETFDVGSKKYHRTRKKYL